MTDRFGDSAARCCSLASRLLGWRAPEFWTSTPAEFAMALATPEDLSALSPPSRETIARMMERDAHE